MDVSDESLIARVAQGDRYAFETLYDRHAARVLGLMIQVIGEREAAEELLQDAFWQVWQRAGTFSTQHRSFTSWLFGIVRGLTAAANRQRNVDPRVMIEMTNEDSPSDRNLPAAEVQLALRSLPREQRQVIEMAYFHGMTRQEIAHSLGKPLETISRLAQLGLLKLNNR